MVRGWGSIPRSVEVQTWELPRALARTLIPVPCLSVAENFAEPAKIRIREYQKPGCEQLGFVIFRGRRAS